jgi:hypothetical protein
MNPMESTLSRSSDPSRLVGDPGANNPVLVAGRTRPKGITIAYWIVTGLFCLEMSFTAYYELMVLPQAAEAFARLGFPGGFFRIELSWAKVAGVLALLVPMVPGRFNVWLKEWAYAGFAINLVSALIAHIAHGDGLPALAPSTITSVLWALSYYFWRRLQIAQGD